MKPLRVASLGLVGGVAALVSAGGTSVLLGVGAAPIQPTPLLALLFAVLAGVLLWLGVHVRRLKARRETWMTHLTAARTAVLAHASALVSAASAGVMLGLAAVALGRLEAGYMMRVALYAALVAGAALLWCVSAIVVERWCQVDPDDEAEHSTKDVVADDPSATPA